MTVMHSLAWTVSPYAYKQRGRPMVAPILRLQRVESMLSANYRRCTGCGRRTGRARRCLSCSRLAVTFEQELGRARQELESERRMQAMEEGSPAPPATPPPGEQGATPVASAPAENSTRFQSLNWGVWGCFIFVTILLVPSHIYLRQYDYRGEFLGIFFVLTLFLLCFSVSMFHSKSKELLLQSLHMDQELHTFPMPTSCSQRRRYFHNTHTSQYNQPPLRRVRSTPDLQGHGATSIPHRGTLVPGAGALLPSVTGSVSPPARTSLDVVGGSSRDPPPYHLAVLLPRPDDCIMRRCETPPPSYEHIQ